MEHTRRKSAVFGPGVRRSLGAMTKEARSETTAVERPVEEDHNKHKQTEKTRAHCLHMDKDRNRRKLCTF
eukprot:5748767-Pleurochrysis_carterae.AAC.1